MMLVFEIFLQSPEDQSSQRLWYLKDVFDSFEAIFKQKENEWFLYISSWLFILVRLDWRGLDT